MNPPGASSAPSHWSRSSKTRHHARSKQHRPPQPSPCSASISAPGRGAVGNGSALEATFDLGLKASKLPEPEREYRFHHSRRWRFDRAWPDLRLAVAIDGGVWTGGRHTRPAGFAEDCNKLNAAALMGWTVLRFTGAHVRQGQAFAVVAEALRVASCRFPD